MKLNIPYPGELIKIINLLDGNARIVGGCVRDYILYDELVYDIDIATPFLPDEMISRLEKDFNIVPTGLKHGTISIFGKNKYEITTLRTDYDTDGRHACVQFNASWEDDSARRDFTINALYADLDGNIYDYQNGLSDLQEKLVRFIGNPHERIHEDYLRIMRFFRFAVRFGNYDQASLAACLELAPNLQKISKERISSELLKIFEGKYFWEFLDIMKPIFKAIGLNDCDSLNISTCVDKVIEKTENAESLCKENLTVLGKLGIFWDENARLQLSNDEKKYVKNLQNLKLETQTDAIIAMQKYGIDFVKDKMILDNQAFELYDLPNMPITGFHLIELGVENIKIGQILNQLNRIWVEKKAQIDFDELLKLASKFYETQQESKKEQGIQ